MIPPRKPGHAALRKGRVSIPAQVYHLTTTTADRQPWFAELSLARIVARTLNAPALLGGSQTLCWVLMPDHLHWLVQLGERQDLSRLVGRFKAVAGKQLNKRLDRLGKAVWPPSFHDHALRRDEEL